MSTEISWTDETWNFLAGCSKISAGCRNCYAINMAHRLPKMADALEAQGKNPGRLAAYRGLTQKTPHGVDWTGEVHFIESAFEQPLKWKKPRKIFINSMSDCFHPSVKDEWLVQALEVMKRTPQHIYQLLTKRPARMLEFFERQDIESPSNLWLGVTVENQNTADERIPLLLQTPAAVRFLSCEPLLKQVDLSQHLGMHWVGLGEESCIHWVIAGGESGPNARPCQIEWIQSIVEQCQEAEVDVWVKQLGSVPVQEFGGASYAPGITQEPYEVEPGQRLRSPKGSDPSEWPEDLRVQQFPMEIAA